MSLRRPSTRSRRWNRSSVPCSKRLKVLGAAVKEHPETEGVRIDITVGGGRRWTLEPQVHLSGCKPDFVLKCDEPNVSQVAVFCDGWLYHASPLHNRLADDAAKRAVLRDAGVFVLAMSWADLVASERVDPPWFDARVVPVVMTESGISLKPAQIELL